jgi:phenylpropionate dioxygenase-like ring-hydroxylating dioxygenase large terminal subunit
VLRVPLHLFAVNPDSCVWYELMPSGPDRFLLRIHACVPPDAKHDDAERFRELVGVIHREDVGACESVQAGLRSALATRGRLSHLEKCNWQFQRWLHQQLKET